MSGYDCGVKDKVKERGGSENNVMCQLSTKKRDHHARLMDTLSCNVHFWSAFCPSPLCLTFDPQPTPACPAPDLIPFFFSALAKTWTGLDGMYCCLQLYSPNSSQSDCSTIFSSQPCFHGLHSAKEHIPYKSCIPHF